MDAAAARCGDPVKGREARMMKYAVQMGDFTARSGSPCSPYPSSSIETAVMSRKVFTIDRCRHDRRGWW